MLIPDISGFTHFVNTTEIIHSVHIIAEMLETLIENNTIGLKVAEVEGDAVFFYRIGEKPSTEELQAQIETMYFAFYKMKAIHDRDRVCDCGACTTVNNLKIKFISHYGGVVERSIHDHFQLMGPDVIKIHKLLKNNVEEDEYLLVTNETISELESNTTSNWSIPDVKTISYKGIGEIKYTLSSLDFLKVNVPNIEKRREIELINKPLKNTIRINRNMEETYDVLINLDLKKHWANGLNDVIYNKNQVHRIGSSHECILPSSTIHIETIDAVKDKEKMTFTEFTSSSFILPSFYSKFTFEKIDEDHCILHNETHYKGSFIQELMLRIIYKRGVKKNLLAFKEFVENLGDHTFKVT